MPYFGTEIQSAKNIRKITLEPQCSFSMQEWLESHFKSEKWQDFEKCPEMSSVLLNLYFRSSNQFMLAPLWDTEYLWNTSQNRRSCALRKYYIFPQRSFGLPRKFYFRGNLLIFFFSNLSFFAVTLPIDFLMIKKSNNKIRVRVSLEYNVSYCSLEISPSR